MIGRNVISEALSKGDRLLFSRKSKGFNNLDGKSKEIWTTSKQRTCHFLFTSSFSQNDKNFNLFRNWTNICADPLGFLLRLSNVLGHGAIVSVESQPRLAQYSQNNSAGLEITGIDGT